LEDEKIQWAVRQSLQTIVIRRRVILLVRKRLCDAVSVK